MGVAILAVEIPVVVVQGIRGLSLLLVLGLMGCQSQQIPIPSSKPIPVARRKGPATSDNLRAQAMAMKIQNHLFEDKHLQTAEIQVSVLGNQVILSGHVESALQKPLAEQIAKQVSGLPTVVDQLHVFSEKK